MTFILFEGHKVSRKHNLWDSFFSYFSADVVIQLPTKLKQCSSAMGTTSIKGNYSCAADCMEKEIRDGMSLDG